MEEFCIFSSCIDPENVIAKVQKQGGDHNANLVLYDPVDLHLIGLLFSAYKGVIKDGHFAEKVYENYCFFPN